MVLAGGDARADERAWRSTRRLRHVCRIADCGGRAEKSRVPVNMGIARNVAPNPFAFKREN